MTRILIVEDDPAQARLLARAFSRRRPDLVVVTSRNGVEATQLMRERQVDLVLTDLQMPEMDGFELLAWMLNNSPGVPVFTMSGYGSEDTARRLDGLGALAYFTKPIDVKSLFTCLSDTLSQSVRGHVHNVSLASFLQLMEMERKTCCLTVGCDDQSGVLVIRKGELVDARAGELHGEAAAIAVIAWPNPSIAIAGLAEGGSRSIEKSLGFIVMEAMRVQDENARNAPKLELGHSEWPAPRTTQRPSSFPPQLNGSPASALRPPNGAHAVAIIDAATGTVLRSSSLEDCPLPELARMAAQVLRQQIAALDLCEAEGIEELVFSTTTRCEVIRPLGSSEFALLVFAPEETNLVMARYELDRFLLVNSRR